MQNVWHIICNVREVRIPMRGDNFLVLVQGDRLTTSDKPVRNNKYEVYAVNEHHISMFLISKKTIKSIIGVDFDVTVETT